MKYSAPAYTPYHQIASHGQQMFYMYRPNELTLKMELMHTSAITRRELERMLREILDDTTLVLRHRTLDAINERLAKAWTDGEAALGRAA